MNGHPSKIHVSEEVFVGGNEDREQHGANHGGGCTLVLRAEALHFHDHLHVLNLQEEFLLGESERAMERRDYPLLGHRSTGARRVPGPHPADPGTGEPEGLPHGAARDALERTEAVWGASPIPAAQPVALFARPDQEFSCGCYGILISVGFL